MIKVLITEIKKVKYPFGPGTTFQKTSVGVIGHVKPMCPFREIANEMGRLSSDGKSTTIYRGVPQCNILLSEIRSVSIVTFILSNAYLNYKACAEIQSLI